MTPRTPLEPLDVTRVLAARRQHGLVAMFDVDGTLAPIAITPAAARVSATTRRALHRLSRRDDTVVGIVSGRPLAGVTRLVGRAGLWLAGIHGAVRCRPGGHVERLWSPEVALEGARVARELASSLSATRGVLVEAKGPVVAVHTRAASAAARARASDLVARSLPAGWTVVGGRRVWELRPAGLPTKADAVRWIATQRPGSVVLYVGDDATDEDAFRTLGRRDFPVIVDATRAARERGGTQRTYARFALRDVIAVAGVVERLAQGDRASPGRASRTAQQR